MAQTSRWRTSLALIVVSCLTTPAPFLSAQSNKRTDPSVPTETERQRAAHALNRLSFGPRPGEVNKVGAKGVDSWIEDQLHPESIDDSALASRLSMYRTLNMPPQQLALTFPSDNLIHQIIDGKRQMPADQTLAAIYSVQIARIKEQIAQQAAKPGHAAASDKDNADAGSKMSALATPQDQARTLADYLLTMPKNERLSSLLRSPPEKLVNFPNLLSQDQKNRLNADFTPQERETYQSLNNPMSVVANELQQAKVLRAVYSERQLLEVMTDFWINHFNVYLYKGTPAPIFTNSFERDVIRPHALGKFRDLLVATAQSPAMLYYLDNWLSIGPHSVAAAKNTNQSGLNENYGRELMELHTLGVDGGYTQKDVTEVARVFTGWTITQVDDGGKFLFDQQRHEIGNKTVLGQSIFDSGQGEGMRVLDLLAHHPATAYFISKKLAERFVADDPPPSLVKRMADTFESSDGDIREVLRTLFRSPEFWSSRYASVKLKTPLEYLTSVIRASGSDLVAPDAVTQNLTQMGMQPYGQPVPTGYAMKAETWETEGALLSRINFVTALTQGKVNGVKFDPENLLTLAIFNDSNISSTRAAQCSIFRVELYDVKGLA